MTATLGSDGGKNINIDGKSTFDVLPLLEMVQEMPVGTLVTAANRTSLSLGPLIIPVGTTVEVPLGSSWVVL